MKSINPYSQKLLKTHEELKPKEILNKINTSYKSFLEFRETSFAYRANLLKKLSELMKDRVSEYAKTITEEMGKPISEAESEVIKCVWVCDYYAENGEAFLKSQTTKTDADHSYIVYQPIGPVLAVMPWNFPFWQVFRFAAPALMAGNTALLKHASNVQLCGQLIEKIFIDAGFKPGVFQNLAIGSGAVAAIIDNPLVKAVTLTGSEAAGSEVASRAGMNIKKSVLELGGNNAFVVLKDADLELASDTAITARLLNGGQSCIAAKRFLIESAVYDEFLRLLKNKLSSYTASDPLLKTSKLGPLANKAQSDEVKEQILRSVASGAVILHEGIKNNNLIDPVILGNINPGMPAFDEEVFGPVFALTKIKNYKEALELANLSDFGLGLNLFTASQEKMEYFIKYADEGSVFINSMVKSDPRLPFGGVKKSGYGRELSREGIREFVNIKTIYKMRSG